MRKSATASVLAAVGVLLPGIVFAHTDVGPVTGFAAGFTHPIGGADHVLAMVAVGLWAAQLGGRARWTVPGAFLGAMVLAGALGIAGVTLPLVEAGVLASVLVLGVLITASLSVPAAVGSLLVAAFAVFHGHAHGTEMPLALGGLAYSAGFAAATGDVVVVQDADLEYDPAELPALLQPIRQGRADAVYGSRFQGGPRRVLFFWHSVGNNLLTLLSNVFTNLNLTDMETCYKLVRRDLLQRLPLSSDRFGFEVEITARLAQVGARIWELPISYSGRTYAEGKKINWKDGVAALWHIFRFNLLPPKAPRFEPRPLRPRREREAGDVDVVGGMGGGGR